MCKLQTVNNSADSMCLSVLALQAVLLLVLDMCSVGRSAMDRTMSHQLRVLFVMVDDLLGHLVEGFDGG